jgi:hypothetical protein
MTDDTAAQTPRSPLYRDVAPETLEADDPAPRTPRAVLNGAWTDYLGRVLPPRAACYSAASA